MSDLVIKSKDGRVTVSVDGDDMVDTDGDFTVEMQPALTDSTPMRVTVGVAREWRKGCKCNKWAADACAYNCWKSGDAADFLGMTPDESQSVDLLVANKRIAELEKDLAFANAYANEVYQEVTYIRSDLEEANALLDAYRLVEKDKER